jgi:hypothetical protein
MRVSDRDRQAAADRLRVAHDEGRLDFAEYDERLARAYQAVLFGDLEPLFTDLPVSSGTVEPARRPSPPTPRVPLAAHPAVRHMPTALKVLWIIWASVVAINLTVWLLVGLGNGPVYFWPMWLLVPGAVLGVVTAGVSAVRHPRPADPGPPALPPSPQS